MLEGKKLYLREPDSGDYLYVKGIWEDSETMADVGGVHPLSLDAYEKWREKMCVSARSSNAYFLVFDRESRECLGEASFHNYDSASGAASLNIKIIKKYRGRKCGRESLDLLLGYYFDVAGGRVMRDLIWEKNPGGLAALLNYGFHEIRRGSDGILVEITASEWKAKNMITFKQGRNWFTFRSAAVILSPDRKRVLLHKNDTDPFWSLPGGRGEFFEPSSETVIREMKEEMGIEASVERLAFVIENFFEYGGCDCHELGFYYLVKPEGDKGRRIYETHSFEGREGEQKLHFKWFDVGELDGVAFYPSCLRSRLKDFSSAVEHIVHKD